ncbi:hypothetical protein P5705_10360 [Pseudomonas entomophila]|uniref:RCC1 domain-containing protein n=1 Tax=Pseudomonas entomophila TaxID=312306 RepID=UPI00240636B7|nr:hypothetical protein [Pseudomonas entomophila]MDF9618046.1 hypothetical protein [Pseudomonas entomophila]
MANDAQAGISAAQDSEDSLQDLLDAYNKRRFTPSINDAGTLDRLYIPRHIYPLKTEGADVGVNWHMVKAGIAGLEVIVQAYVNMAMGDIIDVFWRNLKVASGVVAAPPADGQAPNPGQPGAHFLLYVAAEKVPGFVRSGIPPSPEQIQGVVSELWYTVKRLGSTNAESSKRLNVLSRMVEPGGVDPEPDRPGHFRLEPAQVAVPAGGVTGKQDIQVTLKPYLYMRAYDLIVLSWGGIFVKREVLPAEVGKPLVITVSKAVIRDAGESDNLIVSYRITDEVQRQSSDWSLRAFIKVEFDNGSLRAPLIRNPDPRPPQRDVIDLGKLAAADLSIIVNTLGDTFELALDDVVQLVWRGMTAAGQLLEFKPPAQTVEDKHIGDVLKFTIPNLRLLALGMGSGIAFYQVTRGSETFLSKRTFVSFIGQARGLARPILVEAKDDRVEADSETATVLIEAAVGLLAGDWVRLRWEGTRADGSQLLYTQRRQVRPAQVGKDFLLIVPVAGNLAPLDHGSLQLSYQVERAGLPVPLESESTFVGVGRGLNDLPAPETEPVFADGNVNPRDHAAIEVKVSFFADPASGKRIRLNWPNWQGAVEDLVQEPQLSEAAYFYIDQAQLLANDNSTVEITYTILEGGVEVGTSEPLTLNIGVVPSQKLPPLQILVDGKLWPEPYAPVAANQSVTLRMVAAVGFELGDAWEINWAGQHPGSVHVHGKTIIEGQQGLAREHTIPADFVRASNNGDVVVHYNVFRLSGREQNSDPITLRVQGSTLPLPIFVEAVNGKLNPDDLPEDVSETVPGGATVLIAAAAQLRNRDLVTLRVMGSNGTGKNYAWTVEPHEAGGQLRRRVPKRDILQWLNQDIELSYTLFRDSGAPEGPSESNPYTVSRVLSKGTIRVFGARYNATTYRASSSPRVLSAYSAEAQPRPILVEWQYQGDTTWIAGTSWLDKEPHKVLRVRNQDDAIALNPANVFGTGNDTNVNGTAAFVALIENQPRTPGRFALAYWGMVGWGGRGPAGGSPNNVVGLCATRSACAAILSDRTILTWGNAAEGNAYPNGDSTRFRFLRSNSTAFVGCRESDRSLVGWGTGHNVASFNNNVRNNRDFVDVYGAGQAFAAKRRDGTLVAWGASGNGDAIPAAIANRTDNIHVKGSYAAFVVRRADMSVEVWGNTGYGGVITQAIKNRRDIATLEGATARAFAVLTTGSQVLAWGPDSHGGIVPADIALMTDIVEVTSTWHAFCARRRSGQVVAWGNRNNGGTVPAAIQQLSDIVQVVGSAWSFAALRSNGAVVAWGHADSGGDVSQVPGLNNVRAIYANSNGFTALTSDGRVVTWGHATGGGDSSAAQRLLHGRLVTGHPDTTPGVKVAAENELRHG